MYYIKDKTKSIVFACIHDPQERGVGRGNSTYPIRRWIVQIDTYNTKYVQQRATWNRTSVRPAEEQQHKSMKVLIKLK